MKRSGAPSIGDIVRYEWHVGGTMDTNFAATALVIDESGIDVKIMVFGLQRQSKEDPDKYTVDQVDTSIHSVPRAKCEVLNLNNRNC